MIKYKTNRNFIDTIIINSQNLINGMMMEMANATVMLHKKKKNKAELKKIEPEKLEINIAMGNSCLVLH